MAIKFKTCSVDGCNGNAHWESRGRKGYCNAHYLRWMRHGNPLGGRTSLGEPLRYFNEIVLPYEGDECLLWPFAKRSGYGQITIDGKEHIVSRYLCQQVHGAPPSPIHEASHSCGKGHIGCVTKAHLSWKTRSDNQMDRVEHGTSNRGERCGSAKLTEVDVLAIREDRSGQKEIAKKYGISPASVGMIKRRQRWAHVA